MRRVRNVALACFIAISGMSVAFGQSGGSSRPPERQPEEGPVVRNPTPTVSTGIPPSASGYRAASDPAGATAGTTGGGSLVGPHWGAVSDPEKESEHRIKKLIERLG